MNIYRVITLLFLNLAVIGAIFVIGKVALKNEPSKIFAQPLTNTKIWQVQSIDAMKYTRDIAREKLTKPEFDKDIDMMVANIAATGATHIALGTPYDDEFIPFLTRWVSSARKHKLKVWFRGNFSGWEKWFDYERITRDQHIDMTGRFITQNPSLFEDGDIFTACPECENGGPGDPRQNQSDENTQAYRDFLVELDTKAKEAFASIGKSVETNYYSMNGDVARLIMDEETSNRLGDLMVVDHYVYSPGRLNNDVTTYAKDSNTRVVLGEFGAPIPDIHGDMTEEQQAEWLKEALTLLSKNENLVGLNYWVNVGGSTQLWDYDKKRQAVDILTDFFNPKQVRIRAVNELGEDIAKLTAFQEDKAYPSNDEGSVELIYVYDTPSVRVEAEGYVGKVLNATEGENKIVLIKEPGDFWFDLKLFIKKTFPSIY